MDVDLLSFPDGLFYAVEDQTWARLEVDGSVTVGITSLGIGLAGEIYMCRPKAVGQAVERGRSVAVVELAKAIVAVKAPVAGRVLEVNALLDAKPEWVHEEPYGRGWIARLRPSAWAADAALLVSGGAVRLAMAAHLRQHREREAAAGTHDGHS